MSADIKTGLATAPHLAKLFAQHLCDQIELADLADRLLIDGLTITHDRHTVADTVEFVEAMADEDHRDTAGLQLANDIEEHRDLALIERGGRLVHNHQLTFERDRPRDRGHLLRCDVETQQRLRHVDRDAQARKQLGRLRMHAAPIDQPPAARLPPHEDVLGDRAKGNEVDFLINRANAGGLRLLRRVEVDIAPSEADSPTITTIGAGEDLDQRRLAGAVLADERMNFAGGDAQPRIRQGSDAGKRFGDMLHPQQLGLIHGASFVPL